MMITVKSLLFGAGVSIALCLLANAIAEALLVFLTDEPEKKEK